jgi:hypothetical protein
LSQQMSDCIAVFPWQRQLPPLGTCWREDSTGHYSFSVVFIQGGVMDILTMVWDKYGHSLTNIITVQRQTL